MEKQEAFLEASRCLSCKKPMCSIKGCPNHNPINLFIAELKNENIDGAKKILLDASNMSLMCALVCDEARQCKGNCVLNHKGNPIRINELERFVNENSSVTFEHIGESDLKVFVVGAGPAGLSSAIELAKNGCKVTVFERERELGGLLAYGIPSYRLPKDTLKNYIDEVKKLGIEFVTEKNLTSADVMELLNEYDYGIIACGLSKGKSLRLDNIKSNGVYEGLDFINAMNKSLYFNGEKIELKGITHVVGAGNSAMDAARLALLAGSSEVYITYRRTLEESPASKREIAEAIENGIKFNFLHNPSKIILENDRVSKIECEVMELGEPDESGRRSPVGTNKFEEFKCDNLILAIGQGSDSSFVEGLGINLDHGYIVCDDNYQTSNPKIFACGDIELGASTVVASMHAGIMCAKSIMNLKK